MTAHRPKRAPHLRLVRALASLLVLFFATSFLIAAATPPGTGFCHVTMAYGPDNTFLMQCEGTCQAEDAVGEGCSDRMFETALDWRFFCNCSASGLARVCTGVIIRPKNPAYPPRPGCLDPEETCAQVLKCAVVQEPFPGAIWDPCQCPD